MALAPSAARLPSGAPGRPAPVRWTWLSVLARPSAATFRSILDRGGISFARGLVWMVLAGLAVAAISLGESLLRSGRGLADIGPTQLAAALLLAGAVVLSWAAAAAALAFMARRLGGTGSHATLAGLLAAFAAPLAVVAALLSAAAAHPALHALMQLFWVAGCVNAVRAANRLSAWRAIAATLLAIAAGLLGLVILAAIAIYP